IRLCDRSGAVLIVDEAHATGAEGAAGRGLVHQTGRSEAILATVHTCGKALASMGAFVAGSRTLCEVLVNHPKPIIFRTAFPPYCAAQVSEAIALVVGADAERTQLARVSQYLRSCLRAAGFNAGTSDSQIVPLILGSNDRALQFASALSAAGYAIRAIRPP